MTVPFSKQLARIRQRRWIRRERYAAQVRRRRILGPIAGRALAIRRLARRRVRRSIAPFIQRIRYRAYMRMVARRAAIRGRGRLQYRYPKTYRKYWPRK